MINAGELIGWLGGVFLAICGLPQAYSCFKSGHAEGINPLYLWLWFWGEVLCLLYVVGWISPLSMPLIFNYGLNIVLISIMIKYKYAPRKNNAL